MSAENKAAVVAAPGARITIETRAIPTPGPQQILVRNHAVAVNPADWKLQAGLPFFQKYPTVLGSDVAGVVEQVGEGVKFVKKGDRVTGFAAVIYTQDADEGAFQTYTLLKEIAVAKLPDSISFEEGSTFPMNLATAGAALYIAFGLPVPTSPAPAAQHKGQGLLIYGASSSIGTITIQLASQLGFTVFAVASKQHGAYLKSLGATQFFDRNEADFAKKIVECSTSSSTPISYAFDCIGEGDTIPITADILSQTKPKGGEAKLAVANPWPEAKPVPEGISQSQPYAFSVFAMKPELGSWLFNKYLSTQLQNGTIQPSPPVEIVNGGLESTQEAWDRNQKGVSGKKLVVKV